MWKSSDPIIGGTPLSTLSSPSCRISAARARSVCGLPLIRGEDLPFEMNFGMRSAGMPFISATPLVTDLMPASNCSCTRSSYQRRLSFNVA
ncbi:hypothetical protein FQZ97_1081680 [compost metagenome]